MVPEVPQGTTQKCVPHASLSYTVLSCAHVLISRVLGCSFQSFTKQYASRSLTRERSSRAECRSSSVERISRAEGVFDRHCIAVTTATGAYNIVDARDCGSAGRYVGSCISVSQVVVQTETNTHWLGRSSICPNPQSVHPDTAARRKRHR